MFLSELISILKQSYVIQVEMLLIIPTSLLGDHEEYLMKIAVNFFVYDAWGFFPFFDGFLP